MNLNPFQSLADFIRELKGTDYRLEILANLLDLFPSMTNNELLRLYSFAERIKAERISDISSNHSLPNLDILV